jgi:hypothetical protein
MNNIQVSYPQGSGGSWLSTVLHYCTVLDSEWMPEKINFHNRYDYDGKVKNFHHVDVADNVLSVGNGNYKYNFWRLYIYKRILHELTYKRVRGMRVVSCPYNDYDDDKDDFFQLVNRCRFIQNYQCAGKFKIDWQDLFYNPEKSWNVICEFLEYNQVKNYRTIGQYLITLENYKNTCKPVNININFKHKLFKIWALAFLQNNNFTAPANLFDNFENPIIDDWILSNKSLILDYTNNNCINIK